MDNQKKPKQIIYGQEVRNKILAGVTKTAAAVVTTLGSKGGNVSMEKTWGAPIIVHDGVTVAREVVLPDPFENQAAQLVIEAAQNTNDAAGDGTTTATSLVYALVSEALPLVSAGHKPAVIRKGIDAAVKVVQEELKKIVKPIKTQEELEAIATISAADKEMGGLIAKTIQKVGKDGIVSVQNGTTNNIEVEYKEGMELEKGFLSPYMMTNAERYVAELEEDNKKEHTPCVLIFDEKIDNQKLVPFLAKIYSHDPQTKILIIATEYETEALETIIVTRLRNQYKMVAILASDGGEHRTNILHDLAVVTGGQVLGGNTGMPIDEAAADPFKVIGHAEKIIVTKDNTVIVGGKGEKKSIDARVTAIKHLMQGAKNPYDMDKLEGRIGKLTGGVAVISVGAPSEQEQREKKERIYDAVNATKAAISEGIVPGGGAALLRASQVLDSLHLENEDQMIGVKIVKKALQYPMKKLIENSGAEKPDFILGKILENPNKNYGYNVDSEQYEDLIKTGIIDPLKVTRTALENAASHAIMLITTECMISYERENKKKSASEQDIDLSGIGPRLN